MMSEASSPPPLGKELGKTEFVQGQAILSPEIGNVTRSERFTHSEPSVANQESNTKINGIQPARQGPQFSQQRISQSQQAVTEKKEADEKEMRNAALEYDRIMQCQASQLRSDLSYACILPAILLISVAGKPGLLSLSFGGVATYLLDLLESVEGSLIALALTFLAFTASVIWGLRDLLTSSILNILVFLIMGASILLIFLTAISQYNVILFDVGIFNNIMLQIMFASMPLIFSAFIAGVVSVEAPDFDIITIFNVSYFIFMYLLCRPRLLWRGGAVQHGFRITRERKAHSKPLLSKDLMQLLFIVPTFVSLAVHYAIHRRLPMTEWNRWFQFAYALLVPRFLMNICVFQHMDQVVDNKKEYFVSESAFQDLTILALGYFAPSHPIFDELKTFCAAEEPQPSRVLHMIGVVFAAAALIHGKLRVIRAQQRGRLPLGEEDLGMTNRRTTPGSSTHFRFFFFKFLLDVAIAMLILYVSFLLNIDVEVLPLAIFGGVALNELYHKDDWNIPSLFLLAMISFLTITTWFSSFANSTIAPLQFVMSGLYDLSLNEFSQVTSALLVMGALSPSLISLLDKKMIEDMLLPQATSGGLNSHSVLGGQIQAEWIQWSHYVFSIIFTVITLVTIFLELIVLDQNWESINLEVDTVYPSEYMFATAGMLITTAFFCYRAKIIGLYAMVIASTSNALKMLIFFDIDPPTIFALVFVSLTALYPFFDQLQLSLQFAEDMDKLEFNSHAYEEAREQYRTPWQHQFSAILALALILFSPLGRHISGVFLERLLVGTPVVLWQEVALSAAIWIGYLGMILFLFYPSVHLLRNVCLTLSFLMVLVSCDAFGILVLDTDTGYLHPLDAAHSFLMRGHGQFYLLLSGVLTAATMFEYVALDSLFSCVIYSLVFGFVSTKAIIDWAFPLTLRTAYFTRNGGQFVDLVNRDLYYPFYFLLVMKTIWTMVALYSRRDRSSSVIFTVNFYLGVLLPFLALVIELYGLANDNDHVLGREIHTSRIVGIIWSTLLSMMTLAGSIRVREILFLIDGGASMSSNDNYTSRQKRKQQMSWELMAGRFIKYYYQKQPDSKQSMQALPEHLTPVPGSNGTRSAVAWVVTSAIIWALLVLYFQTTEIDADVLLPIVALCLFLTLDVSVIHNNWVFSALGWVRPSAIDFWAILCTIWWYFSLVYHVFIMHYSERNLGADALIIEMQHRRIMQPYSVFGWDSNVSIWSNVSLFLPLLNLGLAFIPLPGLIYALSPRLFQVAQEDIMFVLGVINLAALIGASVDCVRYLAILSAALCIYRSYAMTGLKSDSASNVGAAVAAAASTFGGSMGPRLMQRDRYL